MKGASRTSLGSMNKKDVRNMTLWDFKKKIECTSAEHAEVLYSKLYAPGDSVGIAKNKCWSVCRKMKELP